MFRKFNWKKLNPGDSVIVRTITGTDSKDKKYYEGIVVKRDKIKNFTTLLSEKHKEKAWSSNQVSSL